MTTAYFDYSIIGAGVIGLAIAHSLSKKNPHAKILLIETHAQFGSETSSRNSEVIHAGIYYPPNSLKADLCRQGKQLLYDFCNHYSVPYKNIGKLIVASTHAELPQLEKMLNNARSNDVPLDFLDQSECHKLEPNVRAVGGLLSSSTGIIDAHCFMQTLLTLAEQQGVLYSPNTHFIKAHKSKHGFDLVLDTSDGEFTCSSRNLINSAGLCATAVARSIEPLAKAQIPSYHLCRGHYFSYQGKSPFSHLIYPMPTSNTAGLGIHATLDLAGQVRFGPDTEYIGEIDYSFSKQAEALLKNKFSQAIEQYFPQLDSTRLQPSYIGIRPKLSAEGEPAQDFMIHTEEDHGVAGLINLFGMESPGLTASLAVANRVTKQLAKTN